MGSRVGAVMAAGHVEPARRARRLRDDDVGPVEAWCDRYAPLTGGPRCSARSQRAVLRAIAWHVDRFGQGAYASVARLVDRSGCSEATVHRARRLLAAAGRIGVTPRPGRGTANAFTIAVGTGVTVTPLRAVPGPSGDTPAVLGEPPAGATVTPEVVGVDFMREEVPPDPPFDDGEPAAPALTSKAPPGPGGAGVRCLRARQRGRPCGNCRACGTSRRQVNAAAGLAAASRPRPATCAGCGWSCNTTLLDASGRCFSCRAESGEQAHLDLDGLSPPPDVPGGAQNGQDGAPRPGSGPYAPGAGT